ncbi:MAG: NADH:flavin oxidoreductase/NADH oxidase [Actinobacteria bacterium]|nr:NADH:flavin oxidoreductase/NADH oxidase [Actinomycetota bacterium]
MSRLFTPLTLRGTTFRNRAWVAPMCQYSSVDGFPTDWHLVHLGARAAGGAGLVLTEATAVTPEGRISPADAGIWSDAQAQAYERITAFVAGQGAVPGIQLAHAGRKASSQRPWDGDGWVDEADGGWQPVAPSALAHGDGPTPKELSTADIAGLVAAFAAAAVRADAAGFEVAEVHAAHGYLVHEFLSPLANERADGYGGGLEGRARFLLEVVDAVRAVWPERKPLFVRVSATDWVEGGWTLEETVEVSRWLSGRGVDLVDVSSGGVSPQQRIAAGPGYQVPLARAVRAGSGLPTAAVGLITEPAQAEQVLVEDSADAVLLARAVLREPAWPLRAQHVLDGDRHPATATPWPDQYLRGTWR